MIIRIDRNIYSDTCISKCIYSFSGECECQRSLCGEVETIELIPRQSINVEDLNKRFLQRLNDYKLREIIAKETKDIRTILYAKAFAESESFELEDVR